MNSKRKNESSHYNPGVVAGSLLLQESRQIARLLLRNADDNSWRQALIVENVLQKGSPASAKRLASLIKKRLELMTPELWEMVLESSKDVAIQCLLAAAIKHSRLLGDFMLGVVKRHYREFDYQLLPREWDAFLMECEHRDPVVGTWSLSTKNKMGQVVYRILAEVRYVDDTRSLKLQPVNLIPEVSKYLEIQGEDYIRKCMEISQ